MAQKKKAALAIIENLTKTAGENAQKRQKCDYPNPKLKKRKRKSMSSIAKHDFWLFKMLPIRRYMYLQYLP